MPGYDCYVVDSVPDLTDPPLKLIAGGDVQRTIRAGHEHLLRAIASCPSESAALVLRYHFTPHNLPVERQSRLHISLSSWARDAATARSINVLIGCSELRAYYGLSRANTPAAPPPECRAACYITRPEWAIPPMHAPDLNPAIPPMYYACGLFVPNPANDYLMLDRVLDRLSEVVVVDLCAGPVDISHECLLHTRDMSILHAINRRYGSDDDGSSQFIDPFEATHYRSRESAAVIEPLRVQDPIADDVLRLRRRFHETLYQPHLAVQLRVSAETHAVARLVASVVAESSFREGSYRLWDSDVSQTARDDTGLGPVAMYPTLHRVLGDHAARYAGFTRLSQVATVEQLLGVFTLPVAGLGSLHCAKKNTDPPPQPVEDLLIVGYDD